MVWNGLICGSLRDLVPFVQLIHLIKIIRTFAEACNFTKNNTPPWFSTFFKLYKWYQITQSFTYSSSPVNGPLPLDIFFLVISLSYLIKSCVLKKLLLQIIKRKSLEVSAKWFDSNHRPFQCTVLQDPISSFPTPSKQMKFLNFHLTHIEPSS